MHCTLATNYDVGRRRGDSGDLAAVDLDPASAASACLQKRRARSAQAALLLVDSKEIGGEFTDESFTIGGATLLRLVQISDGIVAATLGVDQLFFGLGQLGTGVIVIGLQRLTLLHHFEQLVFEEPPLTPDQAAEFVFEFGELLRPPDRPALQECAVTILALTNRVDLAFELANVAIDVVDLDFDGYGRVFTADSLGLETFDFLLLGKRSASVGDPSELSIHPPGEVEKLGLHLWFDVHAV